MNTIMKKIAIIEDETAIRENYIEMLSAQGYQVTGYGERATAETAFKETLPDLAIVDIGLGSEIDGGFLLCQTLRSLSKTLPIIFLTARDSEIDTVCGLRMGADDYLTKDISLAHLAARIGALFRRMEALEQPTDINALITRGPLTLDTQRMQVCWQQHVVDLTVTEFWMLHSLAQRPGHVKSRTDLMSDAKIFVDDSTITSHVKRIRKKFIAIDNQFNCIDTVYGMGYRWEQR
jgi:two-component system OmpR family response regulator